MLIPSIKYFLDNRFCPNYLEDAPKGAKSSDTANKQVTTRVLQTTQIKCLYKNKLIYTHGSMGSLRLPFLFEDQLIMSDDRSIIKLLLI